MRTLRALCAALVVVLVMSFVPRPAQAGKGHDHRKNARHLVVKIARSEVGRSYVWGASGPRYFDCSGLVDYVYRKAGHGFKQRMTTWYARYVGWRVRGKLRPGDLLIMDTGGHMGMYLGQGKVIHASSYRGRVVVDSLPQVRHRIREARRVLTRQDV